MFNFAFKRNLSHGRTSIISYLNSYGLRLEFFDKNGNFHRLNGPAVVYENGHHSWYIDGDYYTEKQHDNYIKSMKLIKENYGK